MMTTITPPPQPRAENKGLQLGGDEDLIPWNFGVTNGATNFLLVLVPISSVKVAVCQVGTVSDELQDTTL